MELSHSLYLKMATLLKDSQKRLLSAINTTMVYTYFQMGKMIVEEEQLGSNRAEYGKKILQDLSTRLTPEFGKGYSLRNLEQMRQFYLIYGTSIDSITSIPQTVSAELEKLTEPAAPQFTLTWSHYLTLVRIKDKNERNFYEIETNTNNWSVRELSRQIDSALFERLALSRDKEKIKELSSKGQLIEKPLDSIKDPYILEFLNLPEQHNYSETELEQELINKLEHFLMELGKGYTFVGRQVRFTFDEEHFRVDLVFYNRFLRCFVLIDLKIGKLKHQDLGQMQMYVNYYDRFVKTEDESPTIGIILCKDKKDTMVEITLPKDNNQIFASRYLTVLPSKEEFQNLIANQS
jgi:predicted nuclease of restriction endonuclease-like (RecB) superfamily